MIDKNNFESKFSRHIGRILTKIENVDITADDVKSDLQDFTKGELWLMCQDLIVMLGMNENDKKETNYNK